MVLIRFPLFWFVDAPLSILRLFPRILDLVEDRFAVGLHAKMIFVPLFRDTSTVGRTLSFIFRVGRVLTGIAAVLGSLMVLAFVFAAWLVLPFIIIIFGGWLGVINVFLAWLGFTLFIADRPHHEITGNDQLDTIDRVATASTKRVLTGSQDATSCVDSLLGFGHIQSLFLKIGVDLAKFQNEVRRRASRYGKALSAPQLYQLSLKHARDFRHRHVTLADVFLALLELVPVVNDALFECGITFEEAKEVVQGMDRQWRLEHPPRFWDPDYQVRKLGGVNRAWVARPTPLLNRLGVDLTRQVQLGKLPPVVDRREAVDEVIQILSRPTRDNVLIVGPAGAGKTTLISGLAESIIAGGADPILFSKRIVRLDVPRLVAGAREPGEIEERIIEIMQEIQAAGNIILFIDQIHNLAAAGSDKESLNIFATFEPFLAESEIQVIGTSSWLDYRRYIEPNGAFARLFQLVEVTETNEVETLKILELTTISLERKYRVTISYKALKAAYQLSERFIHDRVQPDKSLDILEEAAVMVSRQHPGESVTYESIGQIVAQKTEIPLSAITTEESEKLLKLEDKLHQRVIGQNQAIATIADALRRARMGLREEDRPIATLLFIGPTGVGKTEVARALAEAYFGSESAMIRLDMSEFQARESAASLIGPPPGPAGVVVPGRLTEAVRRRPFSLILLDELEKAHADILNLFLQVFEDGVLTDGAGVTVKFNNTIIIATSNAGTDLFARAESEKWSPEDLNRRLNAKLGKYFRPEFLNRLDGIVICGALSRNELLEVVRLKLAKLKEQLAGKDITVEFSEPLVEVLAEKGYDPLLGARPLRRLIQDTVEAYLAKKLLTHEIDRGDVIRLGPEVLTKSLADES